jgi:hypothetical protein
MNEKDKELLVLQSILNYYRDKCSELEYQFILYKAKVEPEIKQLSERLDRIGKASKQESPTSTKERNPNDKTRKEK